MRSSTIHFDHNRISTLTIYYRTNNLSIRQRYTNDYDSLNLLLGNQRVLLLVPALLYKKLDILDSKVGINIIICIIIDDPKDIIRKILLYYQLYYYIIM